MEFLVSDRGGSLWDDSAIKVANGIFTNEICHKIAHEDGRERPSYSRIVHLDGLDQITCSGDSLD
jgi:hypothetical protein